MANHLPRSTLLLKEPLQPVRGHHEEHQGVHKGTPGGNVLRPDVRHLVGRHPPGGRSRVIPGHTGAIRAAASVGGPGAARRPPRSRHPVDRPPPRKSGPARVPIPVAQVAGRSSLVRGGAPDRSAVDADADAPCALAPFPEFLPRIFTSADKASLVLFGVAMGLMAGVFEELGWTGFACPR